VCFFCCGSAWERLGTCPLFLIDNPALTRIIGTLVRIPVVACYMKGKTLSLSGPCPRSLQLGCNQNLVSVFNNGNPRSSSNPVPKIYKNNRACSRLGGVVVSVLATGPKDRGFKPGRGYGFLRAINTRSTPSFGCKVKAGGPMS
jgi:hypothetical protein